MKKLIEKGWATLSRFERWWIIFLLINKRFQGEVKSWLKLLALGLSMKWCKFDGHWMSQDKKHVGNGVMVYML